MLVMVLLTRQAAACDFDYPPAREMIDDASSVFVADVGALDMDSAGERATWTLDIVESWKGVEDDTLAAFSTVDSCWPELEVGDRQLFLLRDNDQVSMANTLDASSDSDFLEDLACELGRGESASGWHLRDEVRCSACATVRPGGALWMLAFVLVPVWARTGRRTTCAR